MALSLEVHIMKRGQLPKDVRNPISQHCTITELLFSFSHNSTSISLYVLYEWVHVLYFQFPHPPTAIPVCIILL